MRVQLLVFNGGYGMKADNKILNALNKVLVNSLTAINQYFLHSKMYRNEGLESLANRSFHDSIREMKDSDKLTERILFLEGMPSFQSLNKLYIGEDTEERLKLDLKRLHECRDELIASVALCESEKDYVTRELLEKVLESQEEQIDNVEEKLGLIEKLGIQNFLAESMQKED